MPTTTNFCGHCGVRISDGCLCADCASPPLPRLSSFAAIGRAWPLVVASSRRCCVTAKDSAILEAMLARAGGPDEHVRNLVHAKLGNARIVLTADVDPDTVTLDSRVRFRLAGDPPAERVVTAWDEPSTPGLTLGVATPLGSALLGMRPGNEAGWVLSRDGIARSLEVLEVAYQPEAARRRARHGLSAGEPGAGERAAENRRTENRGAETVVPLRQTRRRIGSTTSGGDDPGPDAA